MALDLSALKVSDSKAPEVKRGRAPRSNPFIDVALDSFKRKQGKSVTVPNGEISKRSGNDKNVTSVITLIRAAAAHHGKGVSLQVIPGKDTTEVKFIVKDKAPRKARSKRPTAA